MSPAILLRVASGLSLLYFLGHTAGRPWTPAKGPEATAVVEAMRLLAARFFFPLPTAFAVSIAICLGLSFFALRPRQAAA